MSDYESFNLRKMSPMPARRRFSPLPERIADRVAGYEKAVSEPFEGITTDGKITAGLFELERTGISVRPLVDAANVFLASLTPEQRMAVGFDIRADEWRRWDNIHPNLVRHGLLIEDLSQQQRDAALGLLRVSLSDRGFRDVRNVMWLNELLAEITGSAEEYGEWVYFLSIFGTPSEDEPWGWQFDGHHVNLNCLVVGDQVVMTPAFLGSEPCHANSGPHAGTRVFDAEQRDGLAVVRSLSPDQVGKALLIPSASESGFPPERVLPNTGRIMAGAFQDNRRIEYEGLRADGMSDGQRHLLRQLITTYVGRMRDDHAELKVKEVERHLDETHFCWMGGTDDTSPFYYKVQSPVVLIEFDHQSGVVFDTVEPTVHHVHTILRTPNGNDYGMDLLRQHYEQAAHHSRIGA